MFPHVSSAHPRPPLVRHRRLIKAPSEAIIGAWCDPALFTSLDTIEPHIGVTFSIDPTATHRASITLGTPHGDTQEPHHLSGDRRAGYGDDCADCRPGSTGLIIAGCWSPPATSRQPRPTEPRSGETQSMPFVRRITTRCLRQQETLGPHQIQDLRVGETL